jgi:hypothetical protein
LFRVACFDACWSLQKFRLGRPNSQLRAIGEIGFRSRIRRSRPTEIAAVSSLARPWASIGASVATTSHGFIIESHLVVDPILSSAAIMKWESPPDETTV